MVSNVGPGSARRLLGLIATCGLSLSSLGGEPRLFKYAQEGEVTLWGEVLDRQGALPRIAVFRKWAAECLALLNTLSADDRKLVAGTISCAEKLLSVIPEHPEALDRATFDAVVDLSTALRYFPPQLPPYDACFLALGTIREIGAERKNYVAMEAILWPGRSCRGLKDYDEALVLTGTDVVRCTISHVQVSRPEPEGKGEDTPKATVAVQLTKQDGGLPDLSIGQTVVVLRPTSTHAHRNRMQRLRAFYARSALPPSQGVSAGRLGGGNSELIEDAGRDVPHLPPHGLVPTLIRELQESRSAGSSGSPTRRLLPLGLSLACGAAFGAAAGGVIIWLLMRRKSRAS